MKKYNFYTMLLFVNALIVTALQGIEGSSISKKNKIVYMISPPRSLSVAFLRMMEARGDFSVMNEPSLASWCLANQQKFGQEWFKEDTPKSFNEVKNVIFKKAATSNVFVKEISSIVKDFLVHDTELLQADNVQFIFLVRNPHHSVLSFYKKDKLMRKEIKEEDFCHALGYKELYEAFSHIKTHSINRPCIVLSEDLYTHTEATAKALSTFLNVPFKQDSLEWQRLSDNFLGETWDEVKPQGIMNIWHDDAIKSSGFKQPSVYKVDQQGKPTFEEVTDGAHRTICENVYKQSLYFYNKLLEKDAFIIKP